MINKWLYWALAPACLVMLASCAVINPTPASPSQAQPAGTAAPTLPPLPSATPITCALSPLAVPTLPADIPGYTDLDPSTNLHITGTYQVIDPADYSLEVGGKVEHPLSLGFDELRCLPRIEIRTDLICPGYFTDDAAWAGASLNAILDMAGVQPDAKNLVLHSGDGYFAYVPIGAARNGENFLAYEWEGEAVPILHGFPVRAVFPELDGNKWVKWLVKIELE
jgi:DMSO/TMAO reductase YedYZ molybdopterin-dependent catalytic subunit